MNIQSASIKYTPLVTTFNKNTTSKSIINNKQKH